MKYSYYYYDVVRLTWGTEEVILKTLLQDIVVWVYLGSVSSAGSTYHVGYATRGAGIGASLN